MVTTPDTTSTTFGSVAEWATTRHALPDAVTRNAKRGILDVIAVTLAARHEPIVGVLAAGTSRHGSDADFPTVIGQPVSADAQTSAFVNGSLAHALDYDDSSADLGGHPSAAVFPAALAAAVSTGATGRQLLEAYCVGVEVACALGRALNPAHYDSGWHPTATLGAFGAAAAAGRLLGLDHDAMAKCLGLTVAFASGVKASFGTMAKPLQVGRAAMNGVAAAELIAAAANAKAGAFEAKHGFLSTFQRTAEQVAVVLPGMAGQTWSLARPGLIIKQYPCCGSTHSAIEAALRLRADIVPDDIQSCLVKLHPRRLGHVDRPQPTSGLEGKFSVQYTVARALLSGAVRLDDFTADAVSDEQVRRLMSKITLEEAQAADDVPEDRFVGEVIVATTAGGARAHVSMAAGRRPGEMLADELFWQKFEDCCSRALSPPRTGDLRSLVLDLEAMDDATTLVEACRSDVDDNAAIA